MTVSCPIQIELTFKVTNQTMHPRYDIGALVIAINAHPVKSGDHAVIVLADGSYQILKLTAIGENHIEAQQYTPEIIAKIEKSKIKAIYPIRYSIEK